MINFEKILRLSRKRKAPQALMWGVRVQYPNVKMHCMPNSTLIHYV